jgi:hypothetical protein
VFCETSIYPAWNSPKSFKKARSFSMIGLFCFFVRVNDETVSRDPLHPLELVFGRFPGTSKVGEPPLANLILGLTTH